MASEVLTVTQDFVTVDLLLFRRFRSEAVGRVERVIDLNRGICEFVYLPIGMQVLVDIPDKSPPILPVVNVWS